MTIKVASVDSVIIYFGDSISKEISLKVKGAYNLLNKKDGIIALIPSYNSLHITYDIYKYSFLEIKEFLQQSLKSIKPFDDNLSKIITIDVCYDEKLGFDLKRVATIAHISVEEVIQIHSSKIYDVYAIGFLPGFAYMAEIDKRIETARLDSPRKVIPKGSVAIADRQTAIYPQNSPGGWNILGRTAFELFDKNSEDLSPLNINSKIKFNPISIEDFVKQGGVI